MGAKKSSNILPQVDFYLKERILCFFNGVMNFKRIKCLIYTDGPNYKML